MSRIALVCHACYVGVGGFTEQMRLHSVPPSSRRRRAFTVSCSRARTVRPTRRVVHLLLFCRVVRVDRGRVSRRVCYMSRRVVWGRMLRVQSRSIDRSCLVHVDEAASETQTKNMHKSP
jgi:hypothetical protein